MANACTDIVQLIWLFAFSCHAPDETSCFKLSCSCDRTACVGAGEPGLSLRAGEQGDSPEQVGRHHLPVEQPGGEQGSCGQQQQGVTIFHNI